ncbi:hypothetical protein M1349_00695 [Patescibacteria group bacterium]|nr:hypothetical protein [Patescibacteria group bacterium]
MFTKADFKKNLEKTGEIGFVSEVVHSIAHINGLPGAKPQELIIFEDGGFGQISNLGSDEVEATIFTENELNSGVRATRTNKTLEISVGEALLGHTLSPLGIPLDDSDFKGKKLEKRPIEFAPLDISSRHRIRETLNTGVVIIDMMLPVGKGQRELVIGDRKTGKTDFLLRTVLTQAKSGTVCVYAAIGKKRQDIRKVEEFFRKNNVMQNVIIVGSSPQDPTGVIHLTPYSAMTIAEYFRDKGRDSLVILDDLSTHAKFYREIALLGKRFPGRNSYPGDMFFTHARLLERAGCFALPDGKTATITCLPVVETTQGDLSGYIQTNIMSMTDGHIYFDSDLFAKGRRPAINPFLSVTRVGHQTHSSLARDINRELTSFLTLYEKMQTFIHFGAELNDNIKKILATGDKVLFFFNQAANDIIPPSMQSYLFGLLWLGSWEDKSLEDVEKEMKKLIDQYEKSSGFKQKIDELVSKHSTFNDFLNSLRKEKLG